MTDLRDMVRKNQQLEDFPAYRECRTLKLRVVQQLDVRKEGVHVNVDNHLTQISLRLHFCELKACQHVHYKIEV